MKKKLFLIGLLCLSSVTAGCWDMLDIEKEAFIISLGIDLPAEPGSQVQLTSDLAAPEQIRVSMELFSPHLASLNKGSTNIIIVQEAGSLAEAIRLAQGQSSRRLSFAHLRAVVVGESYARQGIKDLLESLERDPNNAYRFRLSFIQGRTAEDVLRIQAVAEKNVAEILTKMGERDPAYAYHQTLDINQFHEEMKMTKGTGYGTRNILAPNDWLVKSGAAIIKDWKLAGWLSPFEVRSTNWLTGKVDATTVTIDTKDLSLTCNLESASSKVTPLIQDNKPSFKIKITAQGQAIELFRGPEEINLELLKKIEDLVAERILDEAMQALHLSQQQFQADYLGLGLALHNKYPELYQSLNWAELYPTVPVDLEVKVRIPRLGSKK